jgi:hypothetical protein
MVRLTDQHTIGRWWGYLKLIAQQANLYVQGLILVFSATSAYAVVNDWALNQGWSIPFWGFALIVFVVLGGVAFVEWKYLIGSTFKAWNHQSWRHDNPMRLKLEEMEKQQAEIARQLSDLTAMVRGPKRGQA